MTCHEIMGLLSRYDAGLLDPREAEGVQAHLATCASCREELAAWQKLDALVRAEEAPAEGDLMRAVMAQVRAGRGSGMPIWVRALDLGAAPMVVALVAGVGLLGVIGQFGATALSPGVLAGLVAALVAGAAVIGWSVSSLAISDG